MDQHMYVHAALQTKKKRVPEDLRKNCFRFNEGKMERTDFFHFEFVSQNHAGKLRGAES